MFRLALLLVGVASTLWRAAASGIIHPATACDDGKSLMTAAAFAKSHHSLRHHSHQRRLVPIPSDKTRRQYAPLCPDGERIDTRRIQECNGPQCFVEAYQACLHITSQECQNPQPTRLPTSRPTPKPSQRPTFGMETTVHPIKITLKNVPPGYELTEDVRALIIRFASETIEEHLAEPMQLIKVEFAGYFNDRRFLLTTPLRGRRRRLDDMSVPLRVTVRGPADMSDYALSFVMDIIQDHIMDGLMNKLRSYDYDTFKNIGTKLSTFNFSDVRDDTNFPTKGPTPKPTQRPTEPRLVETMHPVAIFFKNLPFGYRLAPEDRASVIRFTQDLILEDLDSDLDLLAISYPGILLQDEDEDEMTILIDNYEGDRGLVAKDYVSLPLLIYVQSRADVVDFALAYVLDAFDDENLFRLCRYMKKIDPAAFKNCDAHVETYDLADIGETVVPTLSPIGIPSTQVATADHPIQLVFNRAPPGYTLSPEIRQDFIDWLESLMGDRLETPFQLIKITDAGLFLQDDTRMLQAEIPPSLPLVFRVRGPPDESKREVIQVLRENIEDIELYLTFLDGEAFVVSESTLK